MEEERNERSDEGALIAELNYYHTCRLMRMRKVEQRKRQTAGNHPPRLHREETFDVSTKLLARPIVYLLMTSLVLCSEGRLDATNRAFVYFSKRSVPRRHAEPISTWSDLQTEHARRSSQPYSPTALTTATEDANYYTVQGVDCIPVTMSLNYQTSKSSASQGHALTILEATAQAQDTLVDLALQEETETDGDNGDDNQLKLSSGDPYGAVLWPAAQTIANYVLSNSDRLLTTKKAHQPKDGVIVVELGTGTGLVALALHFLGPNVRQIIATDYEGLPLQLLEFAAKNLNEHVERCNESELSTLLLDVCALKDTERYQPLPPQATLVVAADIMYEPKTGRCLAQRVVEALQNGSKVLIGDSPGRAGRPAFLEELKRLGIKKATFVDQPGWTVTGHRHDLICGKTSQSVNKTPKELVVAVMELDPNIHLPLVAHD